MLIVVLLGDGPKRFDEIRRMVGGISLGGISQDAHVHAAWVGARRPGDADCLPTTPQRVDYELTKLGNTLWDAVEPLSFWARAHASEILRSRKRFDQKDAG